MNIGSMIDGLLTAAKAATAIIPGTTDDVIVAAAGSIHDLLTNLLDKAPDTRTQEQMQTERAKLAEAVKAKAEATADKFDG